MYESLETFTKKQILKEENCLLINNKLTAVEKITKFKTTPDVLFLNLLRFEYDKFCKKQQKLNDKFEFFGELNFDDYCEEKSENNIYSLQSVIVHSGTCDFGHYFVFIKPEINSEKWYKFDDLKVDEHDSSYVFKTTFGGDGDSSAYILVYVRKSIL